MKFRIATRVANKVAELTVPLDSAANFALVTS